MKQPTKKILVADDHSIVRKGLKDTLEDELGNVTIGEAENGREVLDMVRKEKWDLLLLDINMEGRSGLEVLEELRKTNPKLPVLILSMYPEEELAVRALKQGAAGYLSKRRASEEMVDAVKKVLAGGRYISATVAEKLAADLQRESQQPLHESLSNREFQVMRMIAMGRSLKEIGVELSISAKTVGTYHTRLFQKMGMNSDIELTRYALINKLVD
ncbi:MAG: Response regulator, LuxR family [Verrucomicrobiales bacterium]|nr:Response regulator, LuxR family [Verrucomicrobiales bacterium]